jgi:heme/copper-type cytochrome/quinol oxidase subunit 3
VSEQRRSIDVSALPTYAFGHHGLIWWGTAGFMVIEGAMFVVVVVVYFYLWLLQPQWPPSLPYPNWHPAALGLLTLAISLAPNQLAKWRAEAFDLKGTRFWLLATIACGLVAIAIRVAEYPALNARWDSNAYGSIVWVLLSMHTLHLVTDVVDSIVLAVLTFTGPISEQRFVDLSENALYWYFVVLSVIPVYLVLHVAPRLL